MIACETCALNSGLASYPSRGVSSRILLQQNELGDAASIGRTTPFTCNILKGMFHGLFANSTTYVLSRITLSIARVGHGFESRRGLAAGIFIHSKRSMCSS